MTKLPLILTVPPDRLNEVRQTGAAIAHMAYRIGKGPHLFRAGTLNPPKGGLMVIDSRNFDGWGGASAFCQEVFRECAARSFKGVICDFEQSRVPLLEKIVRELGEGCKQRSLTLYAPEEYAHCSPHTRIMISSAISGGSLERRLEEAVARWGKERVVLAIEVMAEDFFLPSTSKNGLRLSREELKQRMDQLGPSVFFSADLCARYFTYMSRDSGAHFILFDDGNTVAQKLNLAAQFELPAAIAAWPEISHWSSILGLGQRG